MKKRKMAIFLAGFLAFANMTACAEETEREGASRKAEIVVVSITGNELTYYEVEDESEEASTEEKTKADEEASTEEKTKADEETLTEAETKIGKNHQKDFEAEKGMSGGMAHKDTKTVYLPVAVPVHADTDETMTFSILEGGDELEVLLEEKDGEEIITEIWLLNAADTGAGA